MGLKDILVHMDNGRSQAVRLRLACEIARRNQGQLTGFFSLEPAPTIEDPPTIGGYAEIETLRLAVARERETAMAGAARAEADFRQAAQSAGVRADWRPLEGILAEVATNQARYADLTVLGQSDPDGPSSGSAANLPESILLGSGRPVLLVPYVGRFETVGRCVLVAWNATREAARAVADALPLMQGAERVTVLSIDRSAGLPGDGEQPAADLVRHLARHGISAEASHLVADDIEAGELLLSRAADLGADLIVAGGYGHSPTRELILGGVTRSLLQHMTVPVLMSH